MAIGKVEDVGERDVVTSCPQLAVARCWGTPGLDEVDASPHEWRSVQSRAGSAGQGWDGVMQGCSPRRSGAAGWAGSCGPASSVAWLAPASERGSAQARRGEGGGDMGKERRLEEGDGEGGEAEGFL